MEKVIGLKEYGGKTGIDGMGGEKVVQSPSTRPDLPARLARHRQGAQA